VVEAARLGFETRFRERVFLPEIFQNRGGEGFAFAGKVNGSACRLEKVCGVVKERVTSDPKVAGSTPAGSASCRSSADRALGKKTRAANSRRKIRREAVPPSKSEGGAPEQETSARLKMAGQREELPGW
jgi:hypothetical protein